MLWNPEPTERGEGEAKQYAEELTGDARNKGEGIGRGYDRSSSLNYPFPRTWSGFLEPENDRPLRRMKLSRNRGGDVLAEVLKEKTRAKDGVEAVRVDLEEGDTRERCAPESTKNLERVKEPCL